MAVASVWRRAWRWRVSSTAPQGGRGGDGGGEPPPPPTGDDSTTSGTTYTATATTSDSAGERPRGFHPFTAPVVMEEHAEEEKLDVAREIDEESLKKLEHMKSLVVEFHGDNLRAVKRWLSELDVGWVLHEIAFAGDSLASQRFQFCSESWIIALREINRSIFICFYGWCSQQREGTSKHDRPSSSEFVRLVEATVFKMLPFINIAAARARPGPVAHEMLQVLIDLHDALSMSLEHVLPLLFRFLPNAQSTDGTMGDLLSAYLPKLEKAIWDTTVETRDSIVMSRMDKEGVDSSGIHQLIRSVTSYAKMLWINQSIVNRILDDAAHRGEHVSFENENVSYLTNLIIEMVRSLEEQLDSNSWTWFPDQSLRFLFLINNSNFMFQELHAMWRFISFPMPDVVRKIDELIDIYLQVSWAPVLKCLQNPAAPRCFTRHYFRLTKFEAKFQKTYSAQQLWKVPDPGMRERLRKAVVQKVLPVYTRFLEDNSIDAPGVTPRKVEKMLGELFEG